MPFASQSARMVMAASPAPRKLALIRNSRRRRRRRPDETRVSGADVHHPGDPPMAAENVGAKRPPKKPKSAANPRPMQMACTAARPAPS